MILGGNVWTLFTPGIWKLLRAVLHNWGANLFAAVRSVIGTAARRGINPYQAIRNTLSGHSVLAPG